MYLHKYDTFQNEERKVCNWHCKHEHMIFQTCNLSKNKQNIIKSINSSKNTCKGF